MKYTVEQVKKIIQEPCMGEPCKELLTSFIKEKGIKTVLEFGSGGSTLMFEELGCEIITIESDLVYYQAIRELTLVKTKVYPILAIDKKSYSYLTALCHGIDFVFIDGKWREYIMDMFYKFSRFEDDYLWRYLAVHDSEREEYQLGFSQIKENAVDLSVEGVNLFLCKNNNAL